MNDLFAAIEQWPPSTWAREDPYAYFVALVLHAWGMALMVGVGLVISLRALLDRSAAAVAPLARLLPVMWGGAILAMPSGAILLLAYPAKALTNPVFAVKFACLLGAVLLVRRLLRGGLPPGRGMAMLCALLWLGAVVAGKLLLHTYRVLTVSG